jgi:TonB family protein
METPPTLQENNMRSVLAAALFLPAALSAQAIHSGVSHLVASVDAPAFAFQTSAINASVPRVFSGLIAPVRLNALTLTPGIAPASKGEVVVEFTVNAAGVPKDVHVVQAMDKITNERVVAAVERIRYTPARLDGQKVAAPVTLHIAFNQ